MEGLCCMCVLLCHIRALFVNACFLLAMLCCDDVQVISGLKNFNAKSVESVVKAANAGGENRGHCLALARAS